MTDIMDRIEKILLKEGIEFECVWEESLDDGWYYLMCNVREKEA